jgi:hypothetical protein
VTTHFEFRRAAVFFDDSQGAAGRLMRRCQLQVDTEWPEFAFEPRLQVPTRRSAEQDGLPACRRRTCGIRSLARCGGEYGFAAMNGTGCHLRHGVDAFVIE